MSENGNEQQPQQPLPQPATPQQQPMAEGKCSQCQATIYLKLPPIRVLNDPMVSMLVLPHERPQTCQKCGMGYVPVIRGLIDGRLDVQFATVAPGQAAPSILPANPQQVRQVEATKSRGLVIP